MVYGDRMKLLFRGRKVHFVKGRFGLRKENLVYEKKVLSQKGRFCLRKEGFIFVYSFALAYICNEMNKLRNEFLSTKGRFYLRKEDICGAQVVSFHYKKVPYSMI